MQKNQGTYYKQANRRKCYWLIEDCLLGKSHCSYTCLSYISVAQADKKLKITKEEETMARIFIADNREFPDPDPNLAVSDVQRMLADFMPELHNALRKWVPKDDNSAAVVRVARQTARGSSGTIRANLAIGWREWFS